MMATKRTTYELLSNKSTEQHYSPVEIEVSLVSLSSFRHTSYPLNIIELNVLFPLRRLTNHVFSFYFIDHGS